MFYKSCSFEKKKNKIYIFFYFWSIPSNKWIYWSKAKIISLHNYGCDYGCGCCFGCGCAMAVSVAVAKRLEGKGSRDWHG